MSEEEVFFLCDYFVEMDVRDEEVYEFVSDWFDEVVFIKKFVFEDFLDWGFLKEEFKEFCGKYGKVVFFFVIRKLSFIREVKSRNFKVLFYV